MYVQYVCMYAKKQVKSSQCCVKFSTREAWKAAKG